MRSANLPDARQAAGQSSLPPMARITTLPSFLRAARGDRALRAYERFDRTHVEEHQREALQSLVAHARARSPFYAELYAAHGIDERTPLESLPPVDKPDLMARFDEWITDPRVTLASAQAHLAGGGEQALNDAFVVLASGGSSRHPGVYVFNRDEWDVATTTFLRTARWSGITPRLPRRRIAFVQASGARHMANRAARSFELGIHRSLRLSATQPRYELVAALNEFRPGALVGYASVIALLAGDQIDGQLDIAPSIVSTVGEPRTTEMTGRIRAAWGAEPFDIYATTETGVLALDCAAHAGRHVFEDLSILEVVDADDQPVPDGERGHHVLVTNLYNRTQPFIRYRLSDMTAYQRGACACGLPFRRLETIDGRCDDILELPGTGGEPVQLHPTVFAPLFALDGVAELEVVQRGKQLHVTVVPRSTAQPQPLTALVCKHAQAILTKYGCDSHAEVHLAAQLSRHPVAGKIKLVRRETE